jgi:hypothetical protein
MTRLISGATVILLVAVGCAVGEKVPTVDVLADGGAGSGFTGNGTGVAGTGAGTASTGTAGTGVAGTGAAGTSEAGTGAAGTGSSVAGTTGTAGTTGAAGTGTAQPDGGVRDGGTTVDVGEPTNTLPAPVATWTEHWFEHVQVLQRVAYNDDVALYFDPDVPATAADWLLPFMTKVWRYTRQTYGEFKNATTDGRLYQISHQGRYSGGHPSTYFDASHDFRNVSDCGPGPWTNKGYDIPTHEVSHVIEGSVNGVAGSPQFGLWGDSKWAEFYLYDVFVALGMTADAQRVYNAFMNGSDSFPQAGTKWFRDWFYPLWRDHGHAQVMVKYFKLLSQHFPKNAAGNRYSRNMNMGEFVHFMSGAAKTNLRAQAATAFGATHPTDAEFAKAQADFPQITY